MNKILNLKLREISYEYAINKNKEMISNLLELVGENDAIKDCSLESDQNKATIKYNSIVDSVFLEMITYNFEVLRNRLNIIGTEKKYTAEEGGYLIYSGCFFESNVAVSEDFILGETKLDSKCIKRVK